MRRSRTVKSLLLGVVVAIFAAAVLVFSRRRRPQLLHGDEAPAGDLDQLPRNELYRRAQAAGIRGRSNMSKAQLVAALRASGEHGDTAAY
jgi:hypothetical protein